MSQNNSTTTTTKKSCRILVETMESELEFQVKASTTVLQLFNEVVGVLMIKETWMFDLMWRNHMWLQKDKKVISHLNKLKQGAGLKKAVDGEMKVMLLVRCFPVNVELEVVSEKSLTLLYLQLKQAILQGSISSTPQTAVLLASYDAIVDFGPYHDTLTSEKDIFKQITLPKSAYKESGLTEDEVKDIVFTWYSQLNITLKEDAIREYMEVVRDLEMYGVEYFSVSNKKLSKLWLGVTPEGVAVYEHSDKKCPRFRLQWGELQHLYAKKKKFLIRTREPSLPLFSLYTSEKRKSELILESCVKNHELFMKRSSDNYYHSLQQIRKLGHLERHHKKAASENQLSVLKNEIEMRKKIEAEKKELEDDLRDYQECYKMALKELENYADTKEHTVEHTNGHVKITDLLKEKELVSKCGEEKEEEEEENEVDANVQKVNKLQVLSSELEAIRNRTHNVRQEMSQYEEEVSSFLHSLFQKYHIVMQTDVSTTQ